MSDLQENTEFLNSYHPVDLNQTLLYTAGRSDLVSLNNSLTRVISTPGGP